MTFVSPRPAAAALPDWTTTSSASFVATPADVTKYSACAICWPIWPRFAPSCFSPLGNVASWRVASATPTLTTVVSIRISPYALPSWTAMIHLRVFRASVLESVSCSPLRIRLKHIRQHILISHLRLLNAEHRWQRPRIAECAGHSAPAFAVLRTGHIPCHGMPPRHLILDVPTPT